mmetsp:Transcript_15984/g.18216  ORF Transcript_15984/g.18216 Transcript_15984/m.18216 type:complete len:351 (+) Transcript_15984:144-1196(+)
MMLENCNSEETIQLSGATLNSDTALSNPAFPTKQAAQEYLASISPPRDLICPITQEIFTNPVVTSDGHTYEKHAIRTWINAQKDSTGSVRSPVTNAYMEIDNDSGLTLIQNKSVAGMARNYKEKLGLELCERCQVVWDGLKDDALGDKAFRIKGLVEAGADLSLKGCRGGNTAFMTLLQSTFFGDEQLQLNILNYFIAFNVPVSLTNDHGRNSYDLVQQLSSQLMSRSLLNSYHQLIQQISQRAEIEIQNDKAKSEARHEFNNEQRERQRTLARNARNRTNMNNNIITGDGLGNLDHGWGYFPSLSALLIQSHVPDPPASFADDEMREKKRLEFILRTTGILVLILLLIC